MKKCRKNVCWVVEWCDTFFKFFKVSIDARPTFFEKNVNSRVECCLDTRHIFVSV